ncbi:MAG: hypothetical protein HQ546_11155, partial [Planctomycetes bacterium]|nr:hypothetical protein [Planctomycetota bacterium]
RFADMGGALAELKHSERIYRDSQIDVTHNHVRLLYSGRLWRTILASAVQGWRVRNFVDDAASRRLGRSKWQTVLFALFGALGGLSAVGAVAGAVLAFALALASVFGQTSDAASGWGPLIGPWGLLAGTMVVVGASLFTAATMVRAVWARADLRRHYRSMLTSAGYLCRAMRARRAEQLIGWHRVGRVSAGRAIKLKDSPTRFILHLMLSVLPAPLHRFLTDRAFALAKLRYIFVRPLRLYFNQQAREQWMVEMLDDGLAHGMVSEDEAKTIRGQLQEPFIQKYLQSLAVHICTLPITQVVSVTVAVIYVLQHPQLSWADAWARALLILGIFQVTPISPGSLTRGFYVLAMMIRDRNYRDYKIAVWIGFWKYIGYLAFPIQMAQRYPAIARFMAGRWATGAVHVIPVFGERGALLEHSVFDLFYNWPLTVHRRLSERAERRRHIRPRRWHVPVCAAVAWVAIAQFPAWLAAARGAPLAPVASPWLLAAAGVVGGLAGSWLAGGAAAGSRIVMGGLCGLLIVVADLCAMAWGPAATCGAEELWAALHPALLPGFATTLLAFAAAAVAELFAPYRRKEQ